MTHWTEPVHGEVFDEKEFFSVPTKFDVGENYKIIESAGKVEINVNNGKIKTLRKNTQVSKGTFSNFMKELQTVLFKYEDGLYNGLRIILSQTEPKKDSNPPNLFDGEINCIIKILKVMFPSAEYKDMLDNYENEIHFTGCSFENLKDLSNKLKCNFEIYDNAFREWKNIIYTNKKKTIKIYVDGNHGILIPNRLKIKYPNLETILPDPKYKYDFCEDIVQEVRIHPHTIIKMLGRHDSYYCATCRKQHHLKAMEQNECEFCQNKEIEIRPKLLAFKCRKCETMGK